MIRVNTSARQSSAPTHLCIAHVAYDLIESKFHCFCACIHDPKAVPIGASMVDVDFVHLAMKSSIPQWNQAFPLVDLRFSCRLDSYATLVGFNFRLKQKEWALLCLFREWSTPSKVWHSFVKKTVCLSCVTRVRQHPPRSKSRFGVQSDGTHELTGGNVINKVKIMKSKSLHINIQGYLIRMQCMMHLHAWLQMCNTWI